MSLCDWSVSNMMVHSMEAFPRTKKKILNCDRDLDWKYLKRERFNDAMCGISEFYACTSCTFNKFVFKCGGCEEEREQFQQKFT